MSRGSNLQEMETGTSQSKTAVNANAKPAEPTPSGNASGVSTPGQTGGWEDLGGPTPENNRPDDESNALKTPGATLKQVKDVVNSKASAPEAPHTSATPVAVPGKSVKEELDEDEEFEYDENGTEEYDEEDLEDEDLEDQIEEDVNALLSGEELSEEFREKAKVVFEAALNTRVKEIRESLEEQYAQALLEEVEEIKLELTERVDAYLEYVCSEWLEENALAVESGLKSEMTESFLLGMKELFENHYVDLPEERYDVLEGMVQKLDEMETKLNEQIQRNIALNNRLSESVATTILNSVSEGLAISQKEKLAALAESVEFESEEDYHQKLVTLRESYFPRNAGVTVNETEALTEENSFSGNVSPVMESYLRVLSSVAKK